MNSEETENSNPPSAPTPATPVDSQSKLQPNLHIDHLSQQAGSRRQSVTRVRGLACEGVNDDDLAIEEPLEIRLEHGPLAHRIRQNLSITMRTPGFDFELAAGFLFTEAIIRKPQDIEKIKYVCHWPVEKATSNVVQVDLKPELEVDLKRLERHFYTSSSCGVCGKTSIEALRTQTSFDLGFDGGHSLGYLHDNQERTTQIKASVIHRLPESLRMAQGLFETTGGLHAAALFSPIGELILLREDVGRHNALDKLIGHNVVPASVRTSHPKTVLPLNRHVLMVSGRASFELIQKAVMAGVKIFAAVGAPSSLAVELAEDMGLTLLGFVRNDRFNIYSHPERIDFMR